MTKSAVLLPQAAAAAASTFPVEACLRYAVLHFYHHDEWRITYLAHVERKSAVVQSQLLPVAGPERARFGPKAATINPGPSLGCASPRAPARQIRNAEPSDKTRGLFGRI